MESSSPEAVRHTHKLLHKFAPSRWRHPRHARSQDAFATDQLTSADRDASYSLPHPDQLTTSLAHHRIAEDSIESLDNPALSSSTGLAPPYTPVPVPERNSSAKKEAYPPRVSSVQRRSATYRLFPKDETDLQLKAHLDRLRGIGSHQNDTSLVAAGFEDDLLLPQPPVPFKPSEHAMSRHVSKESSSPATSRPRGRSRERSGTVSAMPSTPATETGSVGESTARRPTDDAVFSTANRVKSPIGSVLDTLPPAPVKLSNEVVAHLQDPSPDQIDILNTDLNDVDDPNSWDLINPNAKPLDERDSSQFWLEKRAELLYSAEHLHMILKDARYHAKFLAFMRKYRPWRVPILSYYWDSYKAIKAQDYANSLAALLSGRSPLPNTSPAAPGPVENEHLVTAAREAFAELLKDDLHYFIAHNYIKIVSALVARRITGNLPAHLDEASGRLAEVFCVTDCRLRDDPIILASEGFTRHSGGSLEYVLGRNCRFMQGPGTTVDSCRRFAVSCQEQRDHTEIFVNYRRDGTPFLSLVMNAPLLDSEGKVRYFLGAQVDISALLKECAGMESLSTLMDHQAALKKQAESENAKPDSREHIKALSEMFSGVELEIIRKHGGSSQRGRMLDTRTTKIPTGGNRVLLADGSEDSDDEGVGFKSSVHERVTSTVAMGAMDGTPGNLSGVYKHYLLIRPAPSLRVLFASPTMRQPGTLQSPFLHRIGGSGQVREDLEAALRGREGVTARVKWLHTPSEEGDGPSELRFLHCTPLIHYTGQVGLWMIVLIRPDGDGASLHTNASNASRSGSRMARQRRQDLQGAADAFPDV